MTLKSFLKNKDKNIKVQVQLQLSSDLSLQEPYSELNKDEVIKRSHLFDVVEWSVKMNNYEPLVVVIVR